MSMQEQIDKFSIIQNDSPNPLAPINNIENFIKIEVSSDVLFSWRECVILRTWSSMPFFTSVEVYVNPHSFISRLFL